MGQRGDILWVMYCVISTMIIINRTQELRDLVVIYILVHIFARCNMCQPRGGYKSLAVNMGKHCKYFSRDKCYTSGSRNSKIVLELRSALLLVVTGSI